MRDVAWVFLLGFVGPLSAPSIVKDAAGALPARPQNQERHRLLGSACGALKSSFPDCLLYRITPGREPGGEIRCADTRLPATISDTPRVARQTRPIRYLTTWFTPFCHQSGSKAENIILKCKPTLSHRNPIRKPWPLATPFPHARLSMKPHLTFREGYAYFWRTGVARMWCTFLCRFGPLFATCAELDKT